MRRFESEKEWTGCNQIYCEMEADLPAGVAITACIGASLEWLRASPAQ